MHRHVMARAAARYSAIARPSRLPAPVTNAVISASSAVAASCRSAAAAVLAQTARFAGLAPLRRGPARSGNSTLPTMPTSTMASRKMRMILNSIYSPNRAQRARSSTAPKVLSTIDRPKPLQQTRAFGHRAPAAPCRRKAASASASDGRARRPAPDRPPPCPTQISALKRSASAFSRAPRRDFTWAIKASCIGLAAACGCGRRPRPLSRGRNGSARLFDVPAVMHPPLDPLPGHQFGKAEARKDHPDRADDRSWHPPRCHPPRRPANSRPRPRHPRQRHGRGCFFSSASRRMRAAIRLDCAADPPGELIASATAAGFARGRPFRSARQGRHRSTRRAPAPMLPCRRITGTVGGLWAGRAD